MHQPGRFERRSERPPVSAAPHIHTSRGKSVEHGLSGIPGLDPLLPRAVQPPIDWHSPICPPDPTGRLDPKNRLIPFRRQFGSTLLTLSPQTAHLAESGQP